jgi:hypothetical protein
MLWPWIASDIMYAYCPYILLLVSLVLFAKMDRVISAETTTFAKAAIPIPE